MSESLSPLRGENNLSVRSSAPPDNKRQDAQLFSVGNIFKPLRKRNFSLLFSGQLVSNIGDALYVVALPWFMLSGGGGAQALGIVLGAFGIARVVGTLLGGVLSDKMRPRRAMLASDSVRVILTAILAFLVLRGHPALWLLCLVSALLGLFMGNVGVGVLFMLGAGILNGILAVTTMSIIQGALPAHLMGRVMSLFAFANFGLYPISVAIAGVIVPHYGSIPVFLVGGILLALPTLVGCLQPSFWQRGDIQLLRQRS